MSWTLVPVSIGDDIKAAQIAEVYAEIIDRQVYFGGTAPPVIESGSLLLAEKLGNYRAAVEALIPKFKDEFGDYWTKAGLFQTLYGGGRSNWLRRPARDPAGEAEGVVQAGDIAYTEHLNEMHDVLNKLVYEYTPVGGRKHCAAQDSNEDGLGDSLGIIWGYFAGTFEEPPVRQNRSIINYDLRGISPDDLIIAELRLDISMPFPDPFEAWGPCRFAHFNKSEFNIVVSDYEAGCSVIDTFGSGDISEQLCFDVTAQIKSDIQGNEYSSFKVYFNTNARSPYNCAISVGADLWAIIL